ncbi:uncharacterized protein LOC103859632 [Brassica rapa]|uniref:Senescence regulator n=1 Tax=Brassica campestris TaxID=3711 RepID=M4DAR4_BRACM|nr:uncharacterized protein LOC103859632 [Brassica rapa]XP_033148160.1 uncharacterized protein LOC103859632 [Brassica rapa]
MRKGRRLTISRSERFLWDHHKSSDRHMDGKAAVEMELMEEDVWSVMEAHEQPNAWTIRSPKTTGGERRHNGGGTGGLADNNDGRRKKHVASSAPVKVPDWSEISKEEESIESSHNDNASDVGDGEMVPPHEYVARSRNGDGSSSMFLGVGRTLKGRDMRRVRDAVWSQTGFDG